MEIGGLSRVLMSLVAMVVSFPVMSLKVTLSALSKVMKPMVLWPSFLVITLVTKPWETVLFGSRMASASSLRL